MEACSNWPDVFSPLAGRVEVSPFRRERIDRLAHYAMRRHVDGTDQFQDCCIEAGIAGPVDLRLDWMPRNSDLLSLLGRHRRPVIAVQMPRPPFGRSDGYGMELLPRFGAIQCAVDELRDRAVTVQIGSGPPLHRLAGIEIDLTNRTSVADLIDVAWACDGFLGFCSFIVPLAEALNKPALVIWSRRGLSSRDRLIRSIRPAKIFHRQQRSCAVVDDCDAAEIAGAVRALLDRS